MIYKMRAAAVITAAALVNNYVFYCSIFFFHKIGGSAGIKCARERAVPTITAII